MRKIYVFLSVIIVMLVLDNQPLNCVYAEEESEVTENEGDQSPITIHVIDDWLRDYEYTIDDTSEIVEITGYTGSATELTIPARAKINDVEYAVVLRRLYTAYNKIPSGITSISFEKGVILPENCYYMFADLTNLQHLDLSNLNASSVNSLTDMFHNCSSLMQLDLSVFSSSNIIDMSSMFNGCSALTKIDFGNLDTSNITNMCYMFSGCSSLTELDLSKFNTSKVTDMSYMFAGCSRLSKLDLSSFVTSNVTQMNDMFSGCSSLTDLDISSFNASSVTNICNMFADCSSLSKLELSAFKTSVINNMHGMFKGCSCLTKLDLSGFNTSKTLSMQELFKGCSALTELDLSNFDTSNVYTMDSMFEGCSSLSSVKFGISYNTTELQHVISLFSGCKSLKEIDLSAFDFSNILNPTDLSSRMKVEAGQDGFYKMFNDCAALEKIYTPRAINTSLTAALPTEMYELIDGNKLGETAYSNLCKAPSNAVLVSAKSLLPDTDPSDPSSPLTLSVTQADCVYGTPLASPIYDKPKTEGSETLSYTGFLSKDGSEYGPSDAAPVLPGKYTVTVTYKTGGVSFSGSADFVISKAEWTDNKVRARGIAGEDGRFDLSKKLAEGAKLGAVTVTKGSDLLEKAPQISGANLLEWRIKDAATSIDILLSIPVTGAENYNDYTITVNILDSYYTYADGQILLNGEEVASVKDALSKMTDSKTDYVLYIGVDVKEKNLTIPGTARSVTINGYDHTLELVGTKITANSLLSLEQIKIKAVKKNGSATKLTLSAKKELRIGTGTVLTSTSTTINCSKQLILSAPLDAKTVSVKDLTLNNGAALEAAEKNSITVKGTLTGNGGTIMLGNNFHKPVTLKGSVKGTVTFTGEKQLDGTQILRCSSKKISANMLKDAFNVSDITSNVNATYLYYYSNGKAGLFGESINYNGKKYGVWKDAVADMNEDLKSANASAFTVKLTGNVNMKGAFKLPKKGYESITITGNNSIVTFTGNIKLTGNTTIKNITLNKVDKKGNKISGTVNKGKYTYDGPEDF